MVNLVFHSNDVMYPHVLEYIYDNYKDKINDIVYKNDSNLPRYCYRQDDEDLLHLSSLLYHMNVILSLFKK